MFSDDDPVGQLLRVFGVVGLEKEKKWKRLKRSNLVFLVANRKPYNVIELDLL